MALIAHDSKKEDLGRFMLGHAQQVRDMRFVAPEDTATEVEKAVEVEALAPDTLGGDLQVAAAVVEGRIDAVIFLEDSLAALPSEPALSTMLKVCNLEPIPIATNLASAEILLHHLIRRSGVEPYPVPDETTAERVLVTLPSIRPRRDDPASEG